MRRERRAHDHGLCDLLPRPLLLPQATTVRSLQAFNEYLGFILHFVAFSLICVRFTCKPASRALIRADIRLRQQGALCWQAKGKGMFLLIKHTHTRTDTRVHEYKLHTVILCVCVCAHLSLC